MNDNWRNLAAAIINTAMTDKEKARRDLSLNPENVYAKRMLRDCNKFFSSNWCALLLDYLDIDKEKFLEVVNGR